VVVAIEGSLTSMHSRGFEVGEAVVNTIKRLRQRAKSHHTQ
jgi:hypothetical protein